MGQGWKGWKEELWSGPIISIYSAEAADWDGSGYGALLETPCVRPHSLPNALGTKASSLATRGGRVDQAVLRRSCGKAPVAWLFLLPRLGYTFDHMAQ